MENIQNNNDLPVNSTEVAEEPNARLFSYYELKVEQSIGTIKDDDEKKKLIEHLVKLEQEEGKQISNEDEVADIYEKITGKKVTKPSFLGVRFRG